MVALLTCVLCCPLFLLSLIVAVCYFYYLQRKHRMGETKNSKEYPLFLQSLRELLPMKKYHPSCPFFESKPSEWLKKVQQELQEIKEAALFCLKLSLESSEFTIFGFHSFPLLFI